MTWGGVGGVGACPEAETLGPTQTRYRTANGPYLANKGAQKVVTQYGTLEFGLADVTEPV